MSGNVPIVRKNKTSKGDLKVDGVCGFFFLLSFLFLKCVKYAWIFKNKLFKSQPFYSLCVKMIV